MVFQVCLPPTRLQVSPLYCLHGYQKSCLFTRGKKSPCKPRVNILQKVFVRSEANTCSTSSCGVKVFLFFSFLFSLGRGLFVRRSSTNWFWFSLYWFCVCLFCLSWCIECGFWYECRVAVSLRFTERVSYTFHSVSPFLLFVCLVIHFVIRLVSLWGDSAVFCICFGLYILVWLFVCIVLFLFVCSISLSFHQSLIFP